MARIPYSGADGASAPGTISVPNDYQTAQANPSAFGGAEAQGMQAFGQGLQRAGAEASDIAARIKHQEQQTAATAATMTYQQSGLNRVWGDPNNPSDSGFMGLRGQDAIGSYKGFSDGLESDRQAISDGIQDPVARRIFDQNSRRLTFSFSEQAARHRQQQSQQYTVDTNNAAVQLSQRQALSSYGDDEGFLHGLADGVQGTERALRASGASDAVIAAGVASTIDQFQKARVLRMAADGPNGVLAANSYLQANLDKLTPGTQTALLDHLRPQVDRAQATTGATEALGGPSSASVMSGPAAPGVVPVDQRSGLVQQAVAGTMVPAPLMSALFEQESGWKAGAQRQGGSDLGLGQITAATGADPGYGMEPISRADAQDPAKNARWSARYLEARGKAVGLLTPADWQDQSKVSRALTAYNGGGDPNYARNVLQRVRTGGTSDDTSPVGPPDLGAALSRFNAIADRDGYSFDARRSGEAMVHSEVERQLAITHDARVTLQKQAGDVNAALADGRDVTPIDENAIRRAFPAEQADGLVRAQREAQDTGWLMQQIAFASPARLQEIGADIDSGTGPISSQQRVRLGMKLTPAADGTTPDPNNDAQDYQRRRALSQKLVAAVGRRTQMLLDDPAAFVMRDPAIQGVVQAAQAPNATPDQRAAGVQALLNRQAYLGVPEDKRMALPASQAAADVHALTSIDQAKEDMGAALQAKATAYGDAWPDVFGSYVRKGLSPDYQMLATMDRPDQVADRNDFQRALLTRNEPGGVAKLKEAAGKSAMKTIEDGVDDRLSDFRASTVDNQKAVDLYDMVRSSVVTLAAFRASRGESADTALGNAVSGLIDKRYDFDGSMRVPKGSLPDVRRATRVTMAGLTPEDMPVLADSTPGMADIDKQRQLLASIQSYGRWVPTANDDGLQLVGKTYNNSPFVVTRRGQPVVLRFDQIPRGQPASDAEKMDALNAGMRVP